MKKLLLLSIPVLVPGFVLVLLFLYSKKQPPAWRSELDKYVAYTEHGSSLRIFEQAAVRAGRPWEFNGGSGYIVYGDTPYYITENTYQPGVTGGFSRMPLPYPPEELWCVLLKLEPNHAPASFHYQLVFVARHQDLYNADWVIHAAIQPPSSPEIEQTLSRLGCDINVSNSSNHAILKTIQPCEPRGYIPRSPHIARQAIFHLNPAYPLRNLVKYQRHVYRLALRLEQQKLHGAIDCSLLAR